MRFSPWDYKESDTTERLNNNKISTPWRYLGLNFGNKPDIKVFGMNE